jgi:hypothetical protein
MSYGTPLEKKSCANYGSPAKHVSQKYGKDNEGHYHYKDKEGKPLAKFSTTPLKQEAVDLGIVKSNYKGKERKLPFPGKEIYEGTGDYAKYKGRYNPEMLAMNRTYTQKWNEANIPGYTEMKRKQLEMENKMTKEEKSRDNY